VGRRPLAIFVSIYLLGATPAHAATVVILRPANPPPAIVETLVRLKGELTSAGFDTELVDGGAVTRNAGGDTRTGLEQLAVQRRADAVIAIVGEVSPDSVEVWVIDKVTGKSSVRRVPFDPATAGASKILAIRAIELLRSSFLEIDFAADDHEPATASRPPPEIVKFVENKRPIRRSAIFAVEIGVAAVTGLDGVGPAVSPLVRFDWALRPWFLAQAAFAGLGTRSSVDRQVGSADVAQSHGLLGGSFRFDVGERLFPFATVAAGALHTSIDGHADAPNYGRAVDQWSFLVDAGFGSELHFSERFFLSLAAHVQVAEPYPSVRFVGNVVATSASPNLALTLTVGAWL
jgi:hypothetical protein